MRTIIAAIAGIGLAASSVLAQPSAQSPAPSPPAVDCPPGVQPPAIDGRGSSGRGSLSERLAESKGIICPPAGIDREMQITPPAGGVIEVIPPPGTPGGDQSVQPK